MIKKEIQVITNYTIFSASNKIVASLLQKKLGGSISDYFDGSEIYEGFFQYIPNLLMNYQGTLGKGIKCRRGHNIVPLVLRETMAEMIVGNTVTPTLEAKYMALGSGNTTPANADVLLETETLRGLFTNKFAIDNIAYLDKFFSSTEVGGNTYLEAGIFVDGTASVDTGYLLSRILINQTLSVNENLTINASITIA